MASEDKVMYCVRSAEGTFYTKRREYIRRYLLSMNVHNAEVLELLEGHIITYLGNEKTYLNSVTE